MSTRDYSIGTVMALASLVVGTPMLAIFQSSPWAAIGYAAVLVLLAVLLSEQERRKQLYRWALRPTRAADLAPADVDIAPSFIAKRRHPDDVFPPYVSRHREDSKIATQLERLGFVVVKGRRHAGKTRSALEWIRERPKLKVVVLRPVPSNGDNPLLEVLRAHRLLPRSSRYVLVANRLETYMDGLCRRDIDLWLERHRRSCIVATISTPAYDEVRKLSNSGYDDARQILVPDQVVHLPMKLGRESLAQAHELYGARKEVERLGAYLAGAELAVPRYLRAHSYSPTAYALVSAAIRWARAGLDRPLTRSQLIALASVGSPRLPPHADLDAAFAYCCHEDDGAMPLLVSVGDDAFVANSILVDHIGESEAGGAVSGALSAAELRAVSCSATVTPDDLLAIANVALARSKAARGSDTPKLRTLARELFRRVREEGEAQPKVGATAATQATTAETSLIRGDDEPARVEDVLEGAVARPPAPLREATDAQAESFRRRSGSIAARGESRFDPSLPAFRRLPRFYRSKGRRDFLRFVTLATCDSLGVLAAVVTAAILQTVTPDGMSQFSQLVRGNLVAVPFVVVLFAYFGLYRPDAERARLSEIVKGTSIAALTLSLIALSFGLHIQNVPLIVVSAACGGTVSFALRWAYDRMSRRWVWRRGLQARTLIVAPAETAATIAGSIRAALPRPMQFIGFVTDEETDDPAMLGTLESLDEVLAGYLVDSVILADPDLSPSHRGDLAAQCHNRGVAVELRPSNSELAQGAHEALRDVLVPLVPVPPLYLSAFGARVKRLIDVTLSVVLLVVALPMLAAAVLLNRAAGGGRAIIRDFRPGLGARAFAMYRLRTPGEDAGPVLAKLGDIVRRFRFDELPQLWNALRGDMSLVGPRPLTVEEFETLSVSQRRRYAVRPGLTGLWQIARRSEHSLDDMATLDLTYCIRWSPLLDFTVMLRTIPAILFNPHDAADSRAEA